MWWWWKCQVQLVAVLRGCRAAICDKVVSSRGGPIAAVTELIRKRGSELADADVSRWGSPSLLQSQAIGYADRQHVEEYPTRKYYEKQHSFYLLAFCGKAIGCAGLGLLLSPICSCQTIELSRVPLISSLFVWLSCGLVALVHWLYQLGYKTSELFYLFPFYFFFSCC